MGNDIFRAPQIYEPNDMVRAGYTIYYNLW